MTTCLQVFDATIFPPRDDVNTGGSLSTVPDLALSGHTSVPLSAEVGQARILPKRVAKIQCPGTPITARRPTQKSYIQPPPSPGCETGLREPLPRYAVHRSNG